jgi:moderate conductance mechanosensitive channel
MLRAIVSGVIIAITAIALLEVWGIDAAAWFSSGQVGGRLVSALLTITIAATAALAIWEATNAAIEQHLVRLTREGHYMRTARLRTFLPMLRTTLLSIILTVVALTALSELGVSIAPLLAGAGIVGIAIGFGSQKLVQDVITGLFLLLENAMQVGDTVTVSGLSGVVENLSIRTIRLRAADGSIHIIPFSSVTSVTNTNRGIGNAAISVNVAYKEDTDRVGAVLKEIATQMRADPVFKRMMRSDLDLWGVEKVDASMATIVGQIVCTDVGRWPVQREFYRRMKKRFQELNIEIARPSQTTVVLQNLSAAQPSDTAETEERRRTPMLASGASAR